jgi:8-oxo-dGTP pyrophosphatase MutT (NUDIX family)
LHPDQPESGFQRHVRACNNVELPGDRVPFLICDRAVGFFSPRILPALRTLGAFRQERVGIVLDEPAALPEAARRLAEQGLYRLRGEMFDVRADPDGPAISQIDRGAIPSFGTQAVGVHVNGLVQRTDGLHVWVARRARDKQLDPGKLDHIVAGGVPAGLGAAATLLKEAEEEAAIPPELSATAVPVGKIAYAMEREEGLRRDIVYCYDLMLPDDFEPRPADGEVEAFELWPIARVIETVRETDHFKFNVNLVLIDLFQRLGLAS